MDQLFQLVAAHNETFWNFTTAEDEAAAVVKLVGLVEANGLEAGNPRAVLYYLATAEFILTTTRKTHPARNTNDGLFRRINYLRLSGLVALALLCRRRHEQRREITISAEAAAEGSLEAANFPRVKLKANFNPELLEVITDYEDIKEKVARPAAAAYKSLLLDGDTPDKAGDLMLALYEDCLLHFEKFSHRADSLETVAKIHKRRQDIITSRLARASTTPEDRVALAFKLGETLFDRLDAKLRRFERTAGKLSPRLLQKMAFLCTEAIRVYEGILGDERYASEEERIRARFCIARLNNKFFSPDRDEQKAYTLKAVGGYEAVVKEIRRAGLEAAMEFEYRKSVDTADLLRRQVAKMEEPSPYEK